jgi:hypothetical protein
MGIASISLKTLATLLRDSSYAECCRIPSFSRRLTTI